jgi:hypothetical protein
MRFLERRFPRTIKRWLGWILRPRHSYRRIRELRHARNAPAVRKDLDTSRLPKVSLRLAASPAEYRLAVDLYRRNPSVMNIAPRSMKEFEQLLARNVEFYLIFDEAGRHVGNYGYQVERSMLGYLQIDFPHRSGGLALAAGQEIERLLAQRGVPVVYGQVYKENRRAQSYLFSSGWELHDEESDKRYYTVRKFLKADDGLDARSPERSV